MADRKRPGSAVAARRQGRAKRARRRVLVVTGSRAEFGLLVPVMEAIRKRKELELLVCAAGSHFLPPARTVQEVEAKFGVDARVPMQRTKEKRTRQADAAAVGRGIEGFASVYARLKPDWVVVLGDRIEAFAAASAASIAGIAVCHIHGGDRAEGIADEAMRHAITKLSHLHCAATKLSAERIVKMGEREEFVFVTGSPAVDGLERVRAMGDREAEKYGDPSTVILLHPSGLPASRERRIAETLCYGVEVMSAGNVLCIAPNHDPGRDYIDAVLRRRCAVTSEYVSWPFRGPFATMRIRTRPRAVTEGERRSWCYAEHLTRETFLSLLKRLAEPDRNGLLAGNSSAGLIEAQALGLRVVNVGPRQEGRERCDLVVDVSEEELKIIGTRVDWALSLDTTDYVPQHPYGDGRAGERIAEVLAETDPIDSGLMRKRNVY